MTKLPDLKDAVRTLHEMKADRSTDPDLYKKHRSECEALFVEVFQPKGQVVISRQICSQPLWADESGGTEVCYYERNAPDKHCLVCGDAILKEVLIHTAP